MGLYFVRHGQTDWNVRGKLQGKSDIALNETGRLQAVETREKLKQVAMDAIYCSPLMRARETAEIINVLWELPIQCDDRLMERSFGDMEGALRKDVPFDDLWAFSSASTAFCSAMNSLQLFSNSLRSSASCNRGQS